MDLKELLEIRRTYRSFFEEKKISYKDAEEIVKSQFYASRGANRQQLKYICVMNSEIVNKICDISNRAGQIPNDEGRPKKNKRPVMFVIVLKKDSKLSDIDTGLSVSNMTLVAANKKIGSCILKSFNVRKLKDLIEIPDGYEPNILVAFGYPDHKSELIEKETDNPKYYRDERGNYKVERNPNKSIIRFIK